MTSKDDCPEPLKGPPAPLGAPQSGLTSSPLSPPAPRPQVAQRAVQPIFEISSAKKKSPISAFTVFLLFALVVAGLFYLHYQAKINPNAHTVDPLSAIAPIPTTPAIAATDSQPETGTPPPVETPPASEAGIGPIAPGKSEVTLLKAVGAPKMNIVYSSNPAYNCGIAKADRSKLALYATGCYTQKYGATLFLYYGSQSTYDMRYFVLLHEYGHYQQGQLGFLRSKSWNRQDAEADADCRALYLGASHTVGTCTIPNWTPDYLKNKYGL